MPRNRGVMHTRPVTEEVAGSVVGSEQIGALSGGLITPVAEPLPPAAGAVEAHAAASSLAEAEPALPSARVIEAPPAAPSLFAGVPPLLMLALGVIIGAAVSFAAGVVVWSVFG